MGAYGHSTDVIGIFQLAHACVNTTDAVDLHTRSGKKRFMFIFSGP